MGSLKNILVPVDFSKNSQMAFKYAIDFAKHTNGNITLYHSWDQPMVSSNLSFTETKAFILKEKDKTEKKLIKWCNLSTNEGIPCTHIINTGKVSATIKKVAQDKKTDIIIMGTKGASGMKSVFMGSVTSKVITTSVLPVIAVPQRISFKGLDNVIVGLDYLEIDTKAMKNVVLLKKYFQSKLTAIHIASPEFTDDFENFMLKGYAKKVSAKFPKLIVDYKLLRNKDVINGLNKAVKTYRPDLLVMFTSKRSFFGKLIWTSITEKMSFSASVPLFAIPENMN